MKHLYEEWKYPGLLLSAVGISYIGDFIYLVALNLLVYAKTESVAAVAGLWLIGPMAGIVSNSWSGSLIDRLNKKRIMIIADGLRAFLVALIPFFSEMWTIYGVLFMISSCSSFFNPASGAYTVKLVPQEQLLRYNSIASVLITGALVIGPAIAGALVFYGSYEIAIWCNALSFLLSGILLSFLPCLYTPTESVTSNMKGIKTVVGDWKLVFSFLKQNRLFLSVYILFQIIMTFSIALDSQEVVYTQTIIGLSESQYSLLVSITGLGYLTGSLLITVFSSKIPIPYLIGFGSTLFSLGFIIYAFSESFLSACIGFIILGFFSSFANTGYQTFFQRSVPADNMGRVGSTLGFFQSLTLIMTIFTAGFMSNLLGVKNIVIGTSLIIIVFAITLNIIMYAAHPSSAVHSKQKNLAR